MEEFERFLQRARRESAPVEDAHLSERLLTEYVYEQLLEEHTGHIAAHLIRCEACAERVTALRAERLQLERGLAAHLQLPEEASRRYFMFDFLKTIQRWWQSLETWRPVLVHAGSYAAVALALFWANAWLDKFLAPDPGGTPLPQPWWAPLIRFAPWVLVPWGTGLGLHVLYRLRRRN